MDYTYEIKNDDVSKMLFFIRRLDECADVVQVYTILLMGFTSFMAYTILNELDRENTITIMSELTGKSFDIVVITPTDELADRVYGFDLSNVS